MSIIGRHLGFMTGHVVTNPSFVAQANADNSGTTVTINKPTGTADGDLMICLIGLTETCTVTTLSGWTLQGSFSAAGATPLYLFTKLASGEGSSYAWTFSSGSAHGIIATYRGSSIAYDTNGTFSHSASGTSINVSVTANHAGALIVAGVQQNTGPNWSTPSGYTRRNDSGVNFDIGLFDKLNSASGASGNIALASADLSAYTMTGIAFNIYSS